MPGTGVNRGHKKARRYAGLELLKMRLSDIQLLDFFLTANFTLFKYRYDGHQHDTADCGSIKRGKGARPAGQAEDRRAVGNHSQAQLGKAVADQVSEGALDAVCRANSFS
ncbi:Uncharacterised protein [Cedecea neteri]|uniref:Uncharacterized protein n=1 Tax=Cedecea neteri TaxID=158822 RepID=A0A2X2TBB8_9ENTR|nr:Uncharacterised protein [Cedecea neteri]